MTGGGTGPGSWPRPIAVMTVQTLALGFTSIVANAPELVSLMYANVVIPVVVCLYLLFTTRRVPAPGRVDAGAA